jgi:hypothetical protein
MLATSKECKLVFLKIKKIIISVLEQREGALGV